MTTPAAIELMQSALSTTLILVAPLLAALLVVSLGVNILQTVTQLHDHTILFVPKLIGTAAVILLLLPWLLSQIAEYTVTVYRAAPTTH
jgi:flagellar biosynthetic protein FliQ